MAIICRPSDFAAKVAAQLQDYSAETMYRIRAETIDCAKDCVAELKRTSPRRKGKGGGAYARSWTYHQETSSAKLTTVCTVHNGKHYRLTHLLEDGHETRDGYRTRAFPHIKPAEDRVVAEYVKRAKEAIEKG